MVLKGAIALLVAGIICFAVYSFTSKPDFSMVYEMGQSTLHAKVMSSEIYPKTAYTHNALRIKMQGAKKQEYLYVAVIWYRNNSKIHNYNDPVLDPKKFRKGDKIHAEVNLLGPEALDDPVVTLPVKILNTPPRIVEASAVMRKDPSDVIFARVNAVDADADRIKYSFKWFLNDREMGGKTKQRLNISELQNGDQVYAEIVAQDGEDTSPPHKSEPLRIGSNVLAITSQPPNSIGADRRYEYQVSATGPQPEALEYQLITGPSGMKMSKQGHVEWQLPPAKVGSSAYQVVLRVSDPTGGEVFQEFEINLSGTRR